MTKNPFENISLIWRIEHTSLIKLCSRAFQACWTCSFAFWQSSLFTTADSLPSLSFGCHPNQHVNLPITLTHEQDLRSLNSAAWGYVFFPTQSGLCWLSSTALDLEVLILITAASDLPVNGSSVWRQEEPRLPTVRRSRGYELLLLRICTYKSII